MTLQKTQSWLVVAHVTSLKEKKDFMRIFKTAQKNLHRYTDIYIIYIYHKKIGKIFHITSDTFEVVANMNQGQDGQTKWCNKMVQTVLRITQPVAMTYYGHGGGVVIGSWSDPLMSLKKFAKIFVKPVQPKILGLDSCYLGSIVSLYELSPFVNFVLGSPAWHPFTSISSLPLFGKLPNVTNKTSAEQNALYKKYIIAMSCAFGKLKGQPKYSCLVAFDLTHMDRIIPQIKTLVFSEQHNLHLQDPDSYDLKESVEKHLKADIESLVLSKHCMTKCPVKIQGSSVSNFKKNDAWINHFAASRWGKFIKNVKIIKS